MPTFGLEEEVFVCEPTRPSMRSMYYLAKLLARNPRYYYTHSASNFARAGDLKHGIMSGIELSTGVHDSPESLIADLAERRADLSSVADGYIVSMGHLMEQDTPSNVCGLQVHVGGVADKEKVYRNLVHFLPLLVLLTANSPSVDGQRFGKSYRQFNSFAIGPITGDRYYRFQDIIFSKRLGTIEMRACDPTWDISRVEALVKCVAAIAQINTELGFDVERYNRMRAISAQFGYGEETSALYSELKELVDIPEDMFRTSPADQIWDVFSRLGAASAYSAADNGYRNGVFEVQSAEAGKARWVPAAAVAGFMGYFVPKLPYYTWKAIVEN